MLKPNSKSNLNSQTNSLSKTQLQTANSAPNTLDGDMLDESLLRKILLKILKCFLDVAILAELSNGKELSGYDLTNLVKQRFGFSISPSSVYSTLYSMEIDGVIKSSFNGRKRTYKLTKKGRKNIAYTQTKIGEIQRFLKTLVTGQTGLPK